MGRDYHAISLLENIILRDAEIIGYIWMESLEIEIIIF